MYPPALKRTSEEMSFRLSRWSVRFTGVLRGCTDTGIKGKARNELIVSRVAVIGLLNCGKSTLLNQLMKQKVVIIECVHMIQCCYSCLQCHLKYTLHNKER